MADNKDKDKKGRQPRKDDEERRAAPFDPTSEQVVVSAMLRDEETLKRLVRGISSDDVYADRHRIILSVLKELDRKGLKFDIPTFARVSASMDYADRDWGGDSYLDDLVDVFPDGANLDWHLEQMRTDARLRSAADDVAEDLIAEMRRPGADPARALPLARELIGRISAATSGAEAGGVSTGEVAGARYKAVLAERAAGRSDHVPFGLKELDDVLTWGASPGKVTVVAARPSNGKSSLGYNLAKWWIDRQVRSAQDPRPLLFLPLEMGNQSAQDALVARTAGIPVDKIIRGFDKLDFEVQMEAVAAIDRYVGSPWISWFDEPGASIERIEEVLAASMEPDPNGKDGEMRSRYGLVIWDLFDKSLPDLDQATISKSLNQAQKLAREYRTHLALLAQIRRGVEKRGDKRPTREDLKGSGGWEEVADQIIGIHRERVYDPDMEEDDFEIGILKQRVGGFGQWLSYHYDAPTFCIKEYCGSSSE